jgi:hypothetical protein
MASLLELSHELLHCIFTSLSPTELSVVSRTCKALNSYISGNKLLHKDIYLQRYDQPKSDINWEDKTHELIELEKILESPDVQAKRDALEFAASHIDYLLETSSTDTDPEKSLNLQLLQTLFADTTNIDALLCSSTLFGRVGGDAQTPAPTEELRQKSAKLHCMYGVPIDEIPTQKEAFSISRRNSLQLSPSSCTRHRTRPRLTHTFARSKVYDLRQYTDATLWGPFHDDGSQRVDWEKLEAIMIVLGYNLKEFTKRSDGRFPQIWDEPFVGATPQSFVSPNPLSLYPKKASHCGGMEPELQHLREVAHDLNALDPYGVTGTWMRVVCFLDFNDLYAFNFSPGLRVGDERPPIDTEEGEFIGNLILGRNATRESYTDFLLSVLTAIRLIRVKWHVTKIEPADAHDNDADDETGGDGLDWSNFQGERLPIVHFAGTSRSLHASWDPNANSKIRGECNNPLTEEDYRAETDNGTRHRAPNARRPDPLDDLLHLPRRRAMALRRRAGWWAEVC